LTNDPSPGRAAHADQGERRYWLDQPANIDKIVYALGGVCIALVFADGFYVKHGHFEIEHLFGFYGLFGFVVYVGLVLTAKWLRTFLMRDENFYDRHD
jgi:hypothetical protein